jgi:hypothetical protein
MTWANPFFIGEKSSIIKLKTMIIDGSEALAYRSIAISSRQLYIHWSSVTTYIFLSQDLKIVQLFGKSIISNHSSTLPW